VYVPGAYAKFQDPDSFAGGGAGIAVGGGGAGFVGWVAGTFTGVGVTTGETVAHAIMMSAAHGPAMIPVSFVIVP